MPRRRSKSGMLAGVSLWVLCALSAGCDAVLGLGDIEIPGPTGAAGDGGSSGAGGSGAGGATTGGTGGTTAVCGDGQVDAAEQCDDGDAVPLDGCGPDCVIEPGWACGGEPSVCNKTCGDGNVDAAEQCDDGNVLTADGCNQGCQIEAGWECDSAEPTVCTKSCGDGTLDAGETCDDQNLTPADGCGADCHTEPGWMCSQPGGDPNQPSMCTTTCGDGVIAGVEVCDDADTNDVNGCNMDCSAVNTGWVCDALMGGPASCDTVCGDGIPAGTEACDDFNQDSNDGCSPLCALEKTCGNSIVEPTEECDGGPGCTMCTLDAGTVCDQAFVISPGDADPVTGVRTSFYENDSAAAGVAVPNTDVLSQSCDDTFNSPVLHSYTTGKTPSIVTIESLDKQSDGTNTFYKSLVWAYRNCSAKEDLEGCDNDSGNGSHALYTTGYIPAQTTFYIVIAGESSMDKGKYRLQVTEQPVKLFYHEDFGSETMPGAYPLPPGLTASIEGPGGEWTTCVPGPGGPCIGLSIDSHSGGATGMGRITTSDNLLTTLTLRTPQIDLSNLQLARVQYNYVYNDGVGDDFASVVPYNDMSPNLGDAAIYEGAALSGRRSLKMPAVPKASAAFLYNDAASTGAGRFYVDDIFLYGY